MIVPRSKLVAAPLAIAAIAMTLASCGTKPQPSVARPNGTAVPRDVETCNELKAGKAGEVPYTAPPDAQATIKSLLAEAKRLMDTSVAVEAELMEACRVIGRGAGAFDEELKGVPSGGKGAEKVCAIAAAKAQKILDDAKAAKTVLVVDYDKPICFTDVATVKQCIIDCGSPVKGDDRASCTGGELYGTCKGRCGGACANDPGVGVGACWGVCNGKCDKDFRGTCGGKCNGTCNGNPTHGPHRCIGVCDGSCSDKSEGICAGRCDGACSGPWEPRDTSKCSGVCTGQCVGEAGQPVCTGDYVPPGVDATCLATCTAQGAATIRCDAPMVRITVKSGKQTAPLQKLLTGLQAGLPRLLRITEGVSKKLPRAVDGIAAACVEWSNAYATAGAKGLACVRAGIDGVHDGATAVDIAVKGSEAFKPLIQPLLKPADPPPPPADQ